MGGRQPLLGVDDSTPKQGVPLLVLAQVLIHEVAPDVDIKIVLLLVLVLACLKIFFLGIYFQITIVEILLGLEDEDVLLEIFGVV